MNSGEIILLCTKRVLSNSIGSAPITGYFYYRWVGDLHHKTNIHASFNLSCTITIAERPEIWDHELKNNIVRAMAVLTFGLAYKQIHALVRHFCLLSIDLQLEENTEDRDYVNRVVTTILFSSVERNDGGSGCIPAAPTIHGYKQASSQHKQCMHKNASSLSMCVRGLIVFVGKPKNLSIVHTVWMHLMRSCKPNLRGLPGSIPWTLWASAHMRWLRICTDIK